MANTAFEPAKLLDFRAELHFAARQQRGVHSAPAELIRSAGFRTRHIAVAQVFPDPSDPNDLALKGCMRSPDQTNARNLDSCPLRLELDSLYARLTVNRMTKSNTFAVTLAHSRATKKHINSRATERKMIARVEITIIQRSTLCPGEQRQRGRA
ncbi:MAG: hypothetical protein WAM77_32045 [Xanthobacteraceae bacterium]